MPVYRKCQPFQRTRSVTLRPVQDDRPSVGTLSALTVRAELVEARTRLFQQATTPRFFMNGIEHTIRFHGGRDWSISFSHATQCVLAVIGLVLLSPVMVIVALAVKLTSPGPVFYRGVRIGKDARPLRSTSSELYNRTLRLRSAPDYYGPMTVFIHPLGSFSKKPSWMSFPSSSMFCVAKWLSLAHDPSARFFSRTAFVRLTLTRSDFWFVQAERYGAATRRILDPSAQQAPLREDLSKKTRVVIRP